MNNNIDKDLAIGSLVANLGRRSINCVSKAIHIARKKIKPCYDKFKNGIQIKLEFREKKSIIAKYPNIKIDIEKIIEKFKIVDSHFKSGLLYISINPTCIINELVLNYDYLQKIVWYNTIVYLLHKMVFLR